MQDREEVEIRTRAEWRKWLVRNHAASPGIWLIHYKKSSGKARLSYDDIVEEALCFGWVDSVGRGIDAERTALMMTPRKRKSGWSRSNKERVEKLIASGLMTAAGMEPIEAAKRDGSWTALDVAESLTIPPDLAKALAANPTAKKNFDAFTNGWKKQILAWITSAKRDETRRKRIEETISKAAVNEHATERRD